MGSSNASRLDDLLQSRSPSPQPSAELARANWESGWLIVLSPLGRGPGVFARHQGDKTAELAHINLSGVPSLDQAVWTRNENVKEKKKISELENKNSSVRYILYSDILPNVTLMELSHLDWLGHQDYRFRDARRKPLPEFQMQKAVSHAQSSIPKSKALK